MVAMDRLDLLAVMTLILVLLHSEAPITGGGVTGEGETANVPMQVVALAGLVFRPMRLKPALWFLLTALFLIASAGLWWWELENHSLLIMYWCLAFGLSLLATDRRQSLARSARIITGLVFLLALVWKLTSQEFVDGGFFEFVLLTDNRFSTVAEGIGGLSVGASDANAAAMANWWSPNYLANSVHLESAPGIEPLAQAMTAWTLLIEGFIALTFLLPRGRRIGRFGESALLVFIATTYGLAPVVGFGWVLLLLSLAQTSFSPRVAHLLYPVAFVSLQAVYIIDDLWRVLHPL